MSPKYSRAPSLLLRGALPSLSAMAFERLRASRTESAKAKLRAAGRLIPHRPSRLQLDFLALDAEETLFGGAAGAGKSDVALMLVLQHVHVPGYAGAVFRRTKKDANKSDAPLARCREWLRPALEAGLCRWDEDDRAFYFVTRRPDGTRGADSQVHFGYLQHPNDRDRYQGSAFQVIVVDELTQWPEANYRFLFSRLRPSATLQVPAGYRLALRMCATCNPGGRGHEWVKARFVESAKHVITGSDVRADCRRRREVGGAAGAMPSPRIYVSPPSKEALEVAAITGRPAQGAHFVPGFVQDNPFMVGDVLAQYRANLARQQPAERARLEWGDWDAAGDGLYFTKDHFEIVAALPTGFVRWCRSWDFAATEASEADDPDFTAGVRVGVFTDAAKRERVIVSNVKRGRWSPGETDMRLKATAKADGRGVPVLIEQEPGAAGKRGVSHVKNTLIPGHRVLPIRKTGPKPEYWEPLSSATDPEALGLPMLLYSGGDQLTDPWISAFVDELCAIPAGHDDQADAVGTGYGWLTDEDGGRAAFRALAGL